MDSVPLLDLCKFIEFQCRDFDPDIIFTHHPDCLNIDHSLVYRATVTVFRPQQGKSQSTYSYSVPSSTNYNPLANHQVSKYNILNQSEVDATILALRVYDEEMRAYPHTRSYENVINIAKVNGSEIGTEYAEKFKVIREIV